MGGRMVKYLSLLGESEFVTADQVSRVGHDEAGGTIIYLLNGEGVPAREAAQVIADRIDDCYTDEIEFTPDDDNTTAEA